MTGNVALAFIALIVLILTIATAATLYIARALRIEAQEAEDARAASITNTHADPITTQSRATAGPDKRQQPTRAGTHTNRETEQ